jgi:regulation of enolase protein 1 (concanavalin A-like superfamily)
VATGTTLRFQATALDQFGTALTTQPAFTWTATGVGTVGGSGLYTAPAAGSGSGTATIKAAAGTVSSTAVVTVADAVASSPAALTLGSDVGQPALAGSQSVANGTYTLTAGGADIWYARDEFHFAYQKLTGDGTVIARVASVGNSDPWAKGGVMVRGGLGARAVHASLFLTPANGWAFQYRTQTGGQTTHGAGGTPTSGWVRLTRTGTTVTAYVSADGSTWQQVGSAKLAVGTDVYVGLAVTSHNAAVQNTSTFDSVNVYGPSFATANRTASVAAPAPAADMAAAGTTSGAGGETAEAGRGREQFAYLSKLWNWASR